MVGHDLRFSLRHLDEVLDQHVGHVGVELSAAAAQPAGTARPPAPSGSRAGGPSRPGGGGGRPGTPWRSRSPPAAARRGARPAPARAASSCGRTGGTASVDDPLEGMAFCMATVVVIGGLRGGCPMDCSRRAEPEGPRQAAAGRASGRGCARSATRRCTSSPTSAAGAPVGHEVAQRRLPVHRREKTAPMPADGWPLFLPAPQPGAWLRRRHPAGRGRKD